MTSTWALQEIVQCHERAPMGSAPYMLMKQRHRHP